MNKREYKTKRVKRPIRAKLYHVWCNMLRRCDNPNHVFYHRYGGRGIKICDEWRDFETFHTWMLTNGYKPGLQIDRIDNDGDYTPANCRVVTPKENQRNGGSCRMVQYNGQKKCISEWAEITGVKMSTLYQRLNRGWEISDAMNPKYRAHKASKYTGVTYMRRLDKWQANIVVCKKLIYLGVFKKERDAAEAFSKAVLKYRGRNASLDLITHENDNEIIRMREAD